VTTRGGAGRRIPEAPRDVTTDGNGAYQRDPDGTWRYTLGYPDPVPGAVDLRLADLYSQLRPVDVDGRLHLEVPSRWLHERPELAWAAPLAAASTATSSLTAIPADDLDAADHIIGMHAPEITARALLTTRAVADVLDVGERSVSRYLATGRIVAPVGYVSDSPVWALPVLRRWQATRPPVVGGRPRGR